MADPKKVELQNLGDHYNGMDGATVVSIPQYAYMPLSPEKVEQLLADFPANRTKKIDKKLAEKKKAEAKAEDPPEAPEDSDAEEPKDDD